MDRYAKWIAPLPSAGVACARIAEAILRDERVVLPRPAPRRFGEAARAIAVPSA